MIKVDWNLAKSLFQEAIELPIESARKLIQTSNCNEATRNHVLELLQTHFEDDDFLNTPISDPNSSKAPTHDPLIGSTIENFLIQRRIGVGGMGTVYEAHQTNPDRQVAVKVLRDDSSLDETVLTRFKNESDVLARLQHPGIAHIYASGANINHQIQRPWFAMELVDGFHLKEFLRQHPSQERDKIELFLQVCDAVAHAHNRGVIHRDLKPANILVKRTGDIGRTKIVDFGIARLTQTTRMDSKLTADHSILGTLDYLSPEQVDSNIPLDHRCDIYALGVILFEMLTERLPHDRRTGNLPRILANIASEETHLLRTHDRSFSKDLEKIISKAIEFDQAQRYATVADFADDLRRYLNNEPVKARPPSVGYRLRKYIRRNRILLAGTTTTILALVLGLITYAFAANRADRAAAEARYEADKAVAVSSFMTNDFLMSILQDVQSADGNPAKIKLLLRKATDNIDTIFSERPFINAAARNEIGTIYYNLKMFDDAANQYQIALNHWEAGLGPEHPDTLKGVNNLAQARMGMSLSKHPETVALAERAFHSRLKVLGISDDATLRSLSNLARIYQRLGRHDDAKQLYLTGIQKAKAKRKGDPATAITLQSNFGLFYLNRKEHDKAIRMLQQSYESATQIFGEKHQISMSTGIRYVNVLDKTKMYDQASDLVEKLIKIHTEHNLSDSQFSISTKRLAAKVYRHQGAYAKAQYHLESALEDVAKTDREQDQQIRKIERDLGRIQKLISEQGQNNRNASK